MPKSTSRTIGLVVLFMVTGTCLCLGTLSVMGPILDQRQGAILTDIAGPYGSGDVGGFTIPGTAYIDGRDFEASPPLTLEIVNIWDNPSRDRKICDIAHGAGVNLLSSKVSGGRTYFYVKRGSCEGWVAESFLSTSSAEPIGDLVP